MEKFTGKTVASVESCDNEFLITFTDGSEIAGVPASTGGDYGTPCLDIVATE